HLSGSTRPARAARPSFTVWSLGALGIGLALGLIGHATGWPAFRAVAAFTSPIGQVWLNALQLVVLPLVVTQMLTAVTSRDAGGATLGRLGLRTVGLIVFFLTLGGLFTVLLGPPGLRLFSFDAAAADRIIATVAVPDAAARAASDSGGWFSSLVPANLLAAALGGEILGVLAFAIGFGLAVNQLPDHHRDPLARLFAGAAAAMMQLTRWILVVTPI